MSIEEVIDRVIMSQQTIEIEYCTRSGHIFTCEITDIGYSRYYGGGYIVARRTDIDEDRTFKVSRQNIQGEQNHECKRALLLSDILAANW